MGVERGKGLEGGEYNLSEICIVTFLDLCINLGTGDHETRFFILYLEIWLNLGVVGGGVGCYFILFFSYIWVEF